MPVWSKLFETVRKARSLDPDERAFLAYALVLGPVIRRVCSRSRFETALRALARMPRVGLRRKRGPRAIGIETGERLVSVAIRSRRDDACLSRSLTQFILHRRFGPTPRLVIGVRRERETAADGFSAHAWVEADRGPRRHDAFAPIFIFTDARGIERPAEVGP